MVNLPEFVYCATSQEHGLNQTEYNAEHALDVTFHGGGGGGVWWHAVDDFPTVKATRPTVK
jgi:hypothetical protein